MNKNLINFIFNKNQFILIGKSYRNVSNIGDHKQSNQPNKLSTDFSSANYCLDLVKRYDYENFLCTLLLKGQQRQGSLSVRAFNVEVSKIASIVSDDKIGNMRLRFWYDAIEKIYDSKEKIQKPLPDHPVIKELNRTIQTNQLPKLYFTRLIKSRERPSNVGFITAKELEQYAEESVSSIYYLLAKIANSKNMDVDHAISHLGKAQGIVNMLRAQRFMDRQKSVCIPQETLLKHGVSQERILRDRPDDKGVQDCIFEIASLANSHVEKARNLSSKIPKQFKSLLLPTISVDRYLERLRKTNFHLSHQDLAKRDTMLPFFYYWNNFQNKY